MCSIIRLFIEQGEIRSVAASAGPLRHVRIRRLPGIDRDHGGGRSGAWSQRSGQHVANDSLPDERPEHHAEPSAAAAFTQR